MNLQTHIRFILDIEKNVPVQDWTVNNIEVWPLIRARLLKDKSFLVPKTDNITKPRGDIFSVSRNNSNEFIERVFESVRYRLEKRKRKIRYKRLVSLITNSNSDFLVFSGTSYNIRQGSNVFNRFGGPIAEALKKSNRKCLTLEYGFDLKSANLFHPGSLQLEELIEHFRFLNQHLFVSEKFEVYLPKHSVFMEMLKARCAEADLFEYEENKIQEQYINMAVYKEFFVNLLKPLKLKMVFQVCYYSRQGFGLNLACKELGIPCADIQHGVINERNLMYSNWTVTKEGSRLLPNYFFTWGQVETNVINDWAKNTKNIHNAFQLGNVWLEYFDKNKAKWLNDFDTYMKSKYSHIDNVKFVFFTSSPIAKASDLLTSLVDLLKKSPFNYVWLFRKHQRSEISDIELLDALKQVAPNALVEVERCSSSPIPYLFGLADVHLTGWSTTVIDAAQYGVHSILISSVGPIYFQNELDNGSATYVGEDSSIILKEIDRVLNISKAPEKNLQGEINFEERLLNFLKGKALL